VKVYEMDEVELTLDSMRAAAVRAIQSRLPSALIHEEVPHSVGQYPNDRMKVTLNVDGGNTVNLYAPFHGDGGRTSVNESAMAYTPTSLDVFDFVMEHLVSVRRTRAGVRMRQHDLEARAAAFKAHIRDANVGDIPEHAIASLADFLAVDVSDDATRRLVAERLSVVLSGIARAGLQPDEWEDLFLD
jgi:hypothetical protein